MNSSAFSFHRWFADHFAGPSPTPSGGGPIDYVLNISYLAPLSSPFEDVSILYMTPRPLKGGGLKLDKAEVVEARERLGLSIELLAKRAAVSKNSVSRAEHGLDIRPITARRIAHGLGLEVSDLYPKAEAPPSLPSDSPESGERRSSVGQDTFERLIEQYESIRHQIPLFDELSPSGRKDLFDRTWSLRERVYGAQDNLPKPGGAFLHDSLTHAGLFFIEVSLREREQSPGEAVPEEQVGGIASVTRLDEYRQQLKGS